MKVQNRNLSARINEILDSNGLWTTTENEILEIIGTFFSNLYSCIDYLISLEEQQKGLTGAMCHKEEISKAISETEKCKDSRS